jgi:hypothetical protein
MAAAKKLVRLAGDDLQLKTGNNPAQQPNPMALAIAVVQLQDSVNELITRFNAHTHGGVTVGAGVSAVPASSSPAPPSRPPTCSCRQPPNAARRNHPKKRPSRTPRRT